jgi:hypothetical protein
MNELAPLLPINLVAIAVVGSLLWWRTARLETEGKLTRKRLHRINNMLMILFVTMKITIPPEND